ncbi:MAG: SWIM zinc finger family protein, partial [Propionibacteriaceae bacterium]|nr:SWIM zinc finger family protein [Propionibacteriaceae bacterium]
MSEGPDRRAWLAELTEVRLLTVFGPNAVSNGQRYAAMGRVGRIAVGGGEADQVLQANVRGSGRHSYQTVVRISRTGTIGSFCSCPVRTNCKHGVAALWAYRASQLEPAPPQWQRALAQFAETDRRSGASGQPLALQFLRWAGNPVQVRVLTLGKRGGWVRTGIDWD